MRGETQIVIRWDGQAEVLQPALRLMDVVIPEDVHSEQLVSFWDAQKWMELLERERVE